MNPEIATHHTNIGIPHNSPRMIPAIATPFIPCFVLKQRIPSVTANTDKTHPNPVQMRSGAQIEQTSDAIDIPAFDSSNSDSIIASLYHKQANHQLYL